MQNYRIKTILPHIVIFFTLFLILSQTKFIAPVIDQQIGGSIFHENALYMLYVSEFPDDSMQPIFNQFCQEKGRLCAILSGQVDQYNDFHTFIGATYQQFFAIIDAQRRKKYVLPIIQGFTTNDIRIFQSKFQQNLLQPFFSSQQPDPQPYEKCTKLVGQTLSKFLQSQTQIKVLFLYTEHEACQICKQMLRQFADLAQKLYDKQIVSFGYFDIFKNDHPRIKDEILPYFLIFSKNQQDQQPYGLEGEKFTELEQTIIQVALKNTDIDLDRYRREHTINLEQKQNQYQFNYKFKESQLVDDGEDLEDL